MKIMRFALLALALLSPVGLVAQGGGPGYGHRGMPSVDDQVKHLSKELNLTDDQKTQVRTILQDQSDQMKKVAEESSDSGQKGNWSKMREIHEKSSAQIRNVLTDEQKTEYDKKEAERRQHMQERRGGKDEAPPAEQQ
jgi:periplasmic protein CpxP/Spy